MRRVSVIAGLSLLVCGLWAMSAFALVDFDNAPSGTHFTKGSGEPSCVISGSTVSCTGTEVAGVGNTNATRLLIVNASANIVCRNPGNSNIVEPHSTTAQDTVSATIPSTKNGRLRVPAVSESITPSEIDREFSCPNPNWTDEVVSVTITGFTYSVTFAGFSEPFILITG